MAVEIEIGDITEYIVDAIVNSVGTDAGIYGRLCKKIVLASKSLALDNYLKAKNNNSVGDVFYVNKLGNWNLNCEYLINVVTPVKGEATINDLENAYKNCIEKALHLKCKSIAIPLIGTGANGFEEADSFNACQLACSYYENAPINIYIVLYKGVSALTNYNTRELRRGYHVDYGEKLYNYAFTMGEINKKDAFHPNYSYDGNQYEFIVDYMYSKNRIDYSLFNDAHVDSKKRDHWKHKKQLEKNEVFLLIFLTGMNKTEAIQFMIHCNYSLNLDRKEDQFMYEYLTANKKYSGYVAFRDAINQYCHKIIYQ